MLLFIRYYCYYRCNCYCCRQEWWKDVIHKVAKSKSSTSIKKYFPMFTEEKHFSRPLIPFTCFNDKLYQLTHTNKSIDQVMKFSKRYNKCGEKTDRVPTRSCSIDFQFPINKYNFAWSATDITNLYLK